ncbi:MAG TPA: hypothetical protein ENJ42_00495 [Hellea balneolensis]|uniref:DUF4136 domain-containing protein n=1 Tax=Hellea balneolensis TaxID=287478 RepID=A0A7C5LT04_9PROT|nr:hypothetical protein [Hellea balneolensis]
MPIKHVIFVSILALSACATGPVQYGPAVGSGYGFATSQIESDRFQISYTARNEDEAQNMALLRAAEVTLDQGKRYFRVVGRETRGNTNSRSPISTSLGIGIGSGGYYGGGTRTNVGLGIGVYDLARALNGNKVTAAFEILTGDGGHPDAPNVYDARSVMDALRPRAQSQ